MADDGVPEEVDALLLPFRITGPWDDIKPDKAQHFIDVAREGYENTRNPLHAWKAYHEARAAGIAIPEWVLDYLDEAAEALWSLQSQTLSGKKLSNPAAAIAEALRMKKPGRGRGTVFSEFQNAMWIFYGHTVHLYMSLDQKKYGRAKLSQAVSEVANKNDVSESQVWRALKTYEERFIEPNQRLYSKK